MIESDLYRKNIIQELGIIKLPWEIQKKRIFRVLQRICVSKPHALITDLTNTCALSMSIPFCILAYYSTSRIFVIYECICVVKNIAEH